MTASPGYRNGTLSPLQQLPNARPPSQGVTIQLPAFSADSKHTDNVAPSGNGFEDSSVGMNVEAAETVDANQQGNTMQDYEMNDGNNEPTDLPNGYDTMEENGENEALQYNVVNSQNNDDN